ncbi:MAG: imidazole glycerol phosphate synthase subunit HisH [Acidimicrobiia bacterium]
MISVVDYRAGNAPSVQFALAHLGLACRLVDSPEQVADAERIILPGVGAARATIDSLQERGLVDALAARVADGVPFLGICIGLQVLFDHSEEGDTPTLGWVPGTVIRFPSDRRVPQIGWNEVRFVRDHPVLEHVGDTGHFYFVNSYHCVPADDADVLGVTEYGHEFCSVVARDNIVATQFHAEKSGPLGLDLLRGFAAWEPALRSDTEPAC